MGVQLIVMADQSAQKGKLIRVNTALGIFSNANALISKIQFCWLVLVQPRKNGNDTNKTEKC